MSEWKEEYLGGLLKPKGYVRGPFGSSLIRGEMVPEGIPVYEQKNAIYDSREFRFFITDEKFEEMKRFQVETNDLIISCSGTVGKISIIKEEDPKGIISQALLILRPDIDKILLDFLFYFLTSQKGYNLITQVSHGSVQINIAARKIVETIPVPVPPLSEQKAIAEVLTSLDDKIDLLHRQNKTLESMAETLYNRWISEKEFESTINDLIDIQNGYAFKSKSFQDSGYHRVLKIKNINGGIVDIKTTDFVLDSTITTVDKRFIVKTGDILFAMTGAKIGKMGIIPQTENSLWLNQRVGLFKEQYKGSRFLAYLHLKSDFGMDYIDNTATGSAQPNISGTGIENCEFPKFDEQQIIEYSEQLELLLGKVIFNLGQIHVLEKLRDTLLPKLMSGEVRVKYEGIDYEN